MNPNGKQPGWMVVLSTEVRHLWFGRQGPALLLIFSIFLSVYTTLLALDPEMNVLSPRNMTNVTLQTTILVGILVSLLLTANAISGERDQRSLESLMLTPLPRGQIAVGKFLATLSLWLGMLPIAIPYIILVARSTGIIPQAVLLLIFLGSLLVMLCAGIGILISSFAPSNLVSFAASFITILLLAAPNQLPTSVRELPAVNWFIVINPITAIAKYQAGILDGIPWNQELALLLSPVILLILIAALGPAILNRRLSLQGGFEQ
jgi:ABC-2 type transport system permease protein